MMHILHLSCITCHTGLSLLRLLVAKTIRRKNTRCGGLSFVLLSPDCQRYFDMQCQLCPFGQSKMAAFTLYPFFSSMPACHSNASAIAIKPPRSFASCSTSLSSLDPNPRSRYASSTHIKSIWTLFQPLISARHPAMILPSPFRIHLPKEKL